MTTKISELSQVTSLTDSLSWPVLVDGATRRVTLSTVRDEFVKPATSNRLGGIKVGDNLSVSTDGTLDATYTYNLPFASDTRLGGVKVGTGLTVSPTGVLSATYSLPPASYGTLGGIKVGDNLTITEDGTLNAVVDQQDRIEIGQILIGGLPETNPGQYLNYISGTVTDQDIVITASGSGKVKIDNLKTGTISGSDGSIQISSDFVGITTTGQNNLFTINSTAGTSITGDVTINDSLTSGLYVPENKDVSGPVLEVRSDLGPLTLNAAGGNFDLVVGSSTFITATNVGSERIWLNKQVGFGNSSGRLRLPWFTTTQRNAIVTPEQGEIIFNTTTSKLQGYTGSTWVDLH